MVFFFESSEGYVMYMGRDKYENEDLIKYGLLEDMWFHVDGLSSAHVYLRLKPGQRLEDVSDNTIMECAQLVKANSIEGCKLREVYVVYTRWRNLHKTNDMEIGAIGYHDRTKVKRIKVEKDQTIVNKINKTKEERSPDLAALQQQRAEEIRSQQKQEKKQIQETQRITQKKERWEQEQAANLRSYKSIMKEEKMKSNYDVDASVDDSSARKFEEDFF
jgi:hypothetical protein